MKKKYLNLIVLLLIILGLVGCKTITIDSLETTSTTFITTTTLETTTLESTTTLAPTTTTSPYYNLVLTNNSSQTIAYYNNHNYVNSSLGINTTFDVVYLSQILTIAQFKSAVTTLLNDSSICVEYKDSRDHFYATDPDLDISGNFVFFYTGISVSGWDGGYMSREHVWPQNYGDSKTEPGGHDLYNLRPESQTVNNKRGDAPYGNVSNKSTATKLTYQNQLGGYLQNNVFEPNDNVKGDVARILFYYALKYTKYDLKDVVSDDTFKTLLEWNEEDPVSEIEIRRNNYVEGIQGNRNIFVDYPNLAYYFFG